LVETHHLIITGHVQGVGFRPFIYALALRHALVGSVANQSDGVHIYVQGHAIEPFIEAIYAHLPDAAMISSLRREILDAPPYEKFTILESSSTVSRATPMGLERAVCAECLAEMHDPRNRRYGYAFINCTQCGPRYTILEEPPYDRAHTSMRDFVMCAACEAQYHDPTSRFFHAQPIACPDCGPRITPHDGIAQAVEVLRREGIVALKGLGGFHLLCLATSDRAVLGLRERKKRWAKPLAVMVQTLEMAHRIALIDSDEEALLTGAIKPIVLVAPRPHHGLSAHIAPDMPRMGLFLPYTPLHVQLLEAIDAPLVVTSANPSEMPILTTREAVEHHLAGAYDLLIDHNRAIVNALDDSVVQVVAGRMAVLRMGRGVAPLTLSMPHKVTQSILGVGAHQKSAIALAYEDTLVLGGHIGDLGSVESDAYFARNIATFTRYYDEHPAGVVHDLHPTYTSTRQAHSMGVAHYGVQHHYAHILAVMAEFGATQEVLGFGFDGTGLGSDGVLWGGEVMLASIEGFERVGHLAPWGLLGGEKAIREPRRVALGLLFAHFSLDEVVALDVATVRAFSREEIVHFHTMYTRGLNTPMTTSMGRLFDAVASLGGFVQAVAFEGQGAMMMEAYVDSAIEEPFDFSVIDGVVDVRSMVGQIIALQGDKTAIASRFIATVEAIIVHFAALYPTHPLVVAGGVFQNHALLTRLHARFASRTFWRGEKAPTNDGAIALGQAYWGSFHTKEFT